MVNTFFLVGTIKKLTVSTPRDPSKGESAIMLLQYGPVRENSNGPVEFVNAALIRIPNFKFPKLKSKLAVGKKVQVNGHLQGVLKSAIDEGFFTVELVADRVFVDGDDNKEVSAE